MSMPFAGVAEGDYTYSLMDVFQLLQRRVWLIALVTIVLTGAVTAYSLIKTPTYEASVKILVGQDTSRSGPGGLESNVVGLQKLTDTMSEAVNSSRTIAEAVTERLDLQVAPETVLANTQARPVRETQFIQINYRDSSPKRAQQVANAIGEEFSDQISTVSPNANGVTATMWQQAVTPVAPVSPKLAFNVVIALIMSLMLGVGLAILLEYLEYSRRSPGRAEQMTGVLNSEKQERQRVDARSS